MYNFLNNNSNLLTLLNKNFNYIEFELILKFIKNFTFIQIYKYFKTFEILFNLYNLCNICLPKLHTIKLFNINIKLIKFFFLINCIQFIKKKNLINFIFILNINNFKAKIIKDYKINTTLKLRKSLPRVSSFSLSIKKKNLKNKKKNLFSHFILSELYKTYKGVIISFNISNLSWLVRAGLKLDMKLYLMV